MLERGSAEYHRSVNMAPMTFICQEMIVLSRAINGKKDEIINADM